MEQITTLFNKVLVLLTTLTSIVFSPVIDPVSQQAFIVYDQPSIQEEIEEISEEILLINTSVNRNVSLYLDGVHINSSIMANPRPSGTLVYRLFGSSTNTFFGYGDEVRAYNRTLTDVEISEIYASGRTPNSSLPTTGLVLWLPLNENSGTTVHSLNQSDFT